MSDINITLPQFLILAKRCEIKYFGVRGGTCVFCGRTHNLILSQFDVFTAAIEPLFWQCEYSDCGNYNRITKELLFTPPHIAPHYGILLSVVEAGEKILLAEKEIV